MGRHKMVAAPAPVVPEIAWTTPPEILEQELALRKAQTSAIEVYADGLPWQEDHYVAEIRSAMRRGCEAFLRAGGLLIVARECSTHGDWLSILGRVGVVQSQAYRMMEAARRLQHKVSNHATSHDLIAAAGNQSKLIELLSLPDTEFAELAETGEVDGLKLDDVARMTTLELRAAIRDARADGAAKDAVAEKQAARLQTIEVANAKLKRELKMATPDETALAIRRQIDGVAFQVRALIVSNDQGLLGIMRELAEHGEQHGSEQRSYMASVIHELMIDLRCVRDDDLLTLPILD